MRAAIAAAVLALAIAPVPALAATAQDWLVKAERLNGMGVRAMFSSETRPTLSAFRDAAKASREENARAKAAGKPLYCPPDKSARMKPEELIAMLKAVPEERRRTVPLQVAWREAMVKRFPCR